MGEVEHRAVAKLLKPKPGETWNVFLNRELCLPSPFNSVKWNAEANVITHDYLTAIARARAIGLRLPGLIDKDVNVHFDENGKIPWSPAYDWNDETSEASQIIDRVIVNFRK